MGTDPDLSIVVLAWNQLDYTQRCVASIRSGTDVDYELIIVDNGSAEEAASFAGDAADVVILNDENRGFAVGMNQGLRAASGRYVAFVNNDTDLPAGWGSTLISTFEELPRAGIVLPAVTAAGNPFAVRSEPGVERVVVPRFRYLPSGVVYLMDRAVALDLGGWDERYEVASREDLDLMFTVWINDLDVILDERVLVEHASNVTAKAQLPDRAAIWRKNGDVFVDKWSNADRSSIGMLEHPDTDHVDDLLSQARTAAVWLGRVLATEDRIEDWKSEVRELKGEVRDLDRQRLRLEKKVSPPPTPPLPLHKRALRKLRSVGKGS
jgi:glycosyltransferase involved in cell wall biosynthesis